MSPDPTLLVADDNEDNLYTLTLRLNREGYRQIVTAQGRAQGRPRLPSSRGRGIERGLLRSRIGPPPSP